MRSLKPLFNAFFKNEQNLKKFVIVASALVLVLVNWSIYQKEVHLKHGKTVYLKLAPVDPRSLMQGDYMALRFEISSTVYDALPKHERNRGWQHDADAGDGYVVVSLDDKFIGHYKYLYDGQDLKSDEMLLRYRVRNGNVKFATNAYFFQEGHAHFFESAQYGEFKVDSQGELLLIAMYDENLNQLKPL